jgi:hypothetical protein
LFGPAGRQVDQSREPEAARQAPFHRPGNERGIEKGDRERLSNGPFGSALARRD